MMANIIIIIIDNVVVDVIVVMVQGISKINFSLHFRGFFIDGVLVQGHMIVPFRHFILLLLR